jgi:glyoxylate reductase
MKVFSSSPLPGDALASLAESCELVVWSRPGPPSRDELVAELQGCIGLICLLTNRIDEALLRDCPSLEFVSSVSVGVDHLDVAELTRRGIPLGYTPGVLVDTTADLAMGLMLAASRRIVEGDRFVRNGHWNPASPWRPDLLVGKDLSGATLGILGLGAIGEAVAARARGFGMKLIAWNRTERKLPGIDSVCFDELLERSDFLSVHVALAEETRNLLDADALARMKPGAVLVNTARGGIVDEVALVDALRSGRLFAAGIDVFAQEPVEASHPLLQLPNAVLLPHIGSASERTRLKMAQRAVDNLAAALRGERMPYCANPSVYEV